MKGRQLSEEREKEKKEIKERKKEGRKRDNREKEILKKSSEYEEGNKYKRTFVKEDVNENENKTSKISKENIYKHKKGNY